MKCTKCGTEFNGNFCPECGTQVVGQSSTNVQGYVNAYSMSAPTAGRSYSRTCPRCHSTNIQYQTVTEVKEKRKKGCAYWMFIGWWWEVIQWILLGIIKLLMVCFGRKTKVVSETKTYAVCQNCGNRWLVH